jgi:hypothetical protein
MSTSASDNSEEGNASNAPSVVFSLSLLFEIPLGETTNLTTLNSRTWGFEIGYAQGYSADEMLSKSRDGAWFVGMTLKLPPK